MPLNAGQSKLAADYWWLALAVARRTARQWGVQASIDADGPAAEGACEAAVCWTGAGSFPAFLTCVVRRRVYDWARQEGFASRSRWPKRSQVKKLPLEHDTPLAYDDERLQRARERAAVDLHCSILPDAPRRILTRVYRDGWTMKEAAAELGLVRSRGSWYHGEGIAALRAEAG